MKRFTHSLLALATSAVLASSLSAQAQSYGLSVTYSGHPGDTASYAFAYPTFTISNLSSAGITLSSVAMDSGSFAAGLWDYVAAETSSAGSTYTLTHGDRANDNSWWTQVAYSFSNLAAGGFMQFSVDPDTYHAGTGNVVDSRGYLFGNGAAANGSFVATFTNGQSLTLTWPENPLAHSFAPLRLPAQSAADDRNIYYQMELVQTVPEPSMLALLATTLVLGRCRSRRSQPPQG